MRLRTDVVLLVYLVLAWYHIHDLSVTPINPKAATISVSNHDYSAVTAPSSLSSPATTSLSIVTPPTVTLAVLKEAKAAGIPAVWLQPGSFDAEGLDYAKNEFEAAIGGQGGRGGEGWCVLIDGEAGLEAAGRDQGEDQKSRI